MTINKSQKSHQCRNRGSWTHFHPPPSDKLPSGVALWTDHTRRHKYVVSDLTNNSRATLLNQRANFFKLERTSYISHELKPKPIEKLWIRIKI